MAAFAALVDQYDLGHLHGERDRVAISVFTLDGLQAVRAACHLHGMLAIARTPRHKRRDPVKAHAHAHTAQHEELGFVRFEAQSSPEHQQLAQGIWPIQDPDLGIRHRVQDLAPPLVDQVGRRDHQRARVRALHQRCRTDGHHGFTSAHIGIQDRCRFIVVKQKLDHGMHCIGLGLERLALEAIQDGLARLPDGLQLVELRVIDGRVLASHLFQQAITELLDEGRQRHVVAVTPLVGALTDIGRRKVSSGLRLQRCAWFNGCRVHSGSPG